MRPAQRGRFRSTNVTPAPPPAAASLQGCRLHLAAHAANISDNCCFKRTPIGRRSRLLAIYGHPRTVPERQIDNIASRTSASGGRLRLKGPGERRIAGET
ncbi:hypothetical protein Ari01nite_01370 [Paractinoplanes rishiriensis]|uniref:Uncharacterized protein n=1 Tax=Paractinoplanes rishiriensis TaxID=1050105 RepID=A0A919JSR8_9ACTN|nr:hypothetical protein Ari01nite_01370 [Actinoplanes rishiriensis]